jgi:hypothetical protein
MVESTKVSTTETATTTPAPAATATVAVAANGITTGHADYNNDDEDELPSKSLYEIWEEEQNKPKVIKNRDEYILFAETIAKVTSVGFVGAIYGLGVQHKKESTVQYNDYTDRIQLVERQQQTKTYSSLPVTTNNDTTNNNATQYRQSIRTRKPPITKFSTYHQRTNNIMSLSLATGNLPWAYAITMMTLVSILETVRIVSPTTKLYNTYTVYQQEQKQQELLLQQQNQHQQTQQQSSISVVDTTTAITDSIEKKRKKKSFYDINKEQIQKDSIISIGDCIIGGSIGGLAISLAQKQYQQKQLLQIRTIPIHHPSIIVTVGYGIMIGSVCGFLIGTGTTLINIGTQYNTYKYNLYIQRQQRKQQKLLQQQQEEQEQNKDK